MKPFFIFAKRLFVLFLSRSYFQSITFSEYLAGIRHLFGLKVDLAVPTSISLESISQLKGAGHASGGGTSIYSSAVSLSYDNGYYDYLDLGASSERLFVFDYAVITKEYGVHDLFGRPVLGSVLVRGKLQDASSFPNGYPRAINIRSSLGCFQQFERIPRAFYVTYMFMNHVGHELTEVVSAIYPLLIWKQQGEDFSRMPIIVNQQFAPYLEDLSRILGVGLDQILVPGLNCGPLLVETAYFAPPTFVLKSFVCSTHHRHVKNYFHLIYGDRFSQVLSVEPSVKNKIYVSRSKIGFRQRQFLQEKDLERELEALGWTVFHPQESSRQEQLKTYQSSTHICALEGSALHFLLGINVVFISRVVLLSESYRNDFVLQLTAQDVPFSVIHCLEKDTYPPFVRNNINVRLREGFDPCSLASLIDSSALDD